MFGECVMKPYYETKLGKLYHGDCLEIMPLLEPVDLIITSPPYDNLRKYGGKTFNFNKFHQMVVLFRFIAKDGAVVVWVVNDATIEGSETGTSFKQALHFKKLGFNLHDTMIWEKTNPMPCIKKSYYTPSFEYMFVLSRGTPKTFNLITEPCKHAGKIIKTTNTNKESIKKANKDIPVKNTKIKRNVWRYTLAGTNYGHPAIFPEALAQDHILSWSNEKDIVLDIFLGSGTTAVSCEKNNRRWIGIEIEEKYCEIAAKRIEQETKQLKLWN